jgi:predicted MFS family arabinose efflux permease
VTTVERATYREVFAEPRFRVLFMSRSVAIAADALRIFALSVLVFARTGSPLLSALAFAAGFLPQIVGGLLFGAAADRMRPRRLIFLGYALEAALAVLLATAHLPVAVSLGLVGLVACGTPVFAGAAGRLVAEVLTGDAYVLGRSVFNAAASGAQLLGLAAGGVAVAAAGPRAALLIAAAGNAAAALIVRFGLPDLAGAAPVGREGSAVRASLTGAARLFADRTVRRLLLVQWLPSAFVAGAEALLVAYATWRGFPAGAAGALMAALPVGMLVGDLVVGRCLRPATRERLSAPLVVLLGAPLVALAIGPPLAVTIGLLTLAGTGFAYGLGLQRRFLAAAPEASRGQLFAMLSTGLMTLQGLGPLLFGAAAELTTPGLAIAAAGVATVTLALLVPA